MNRMTPAGSSRPRSPHRSIIKSVIDDIVKENPQEVVGILPSQVGLGSDIREVTEGGLKPIYDSIKSIGWLPDTHPLVTYNPKANEEGQVPYLCVDGMHRIVALLRLESERDDRFVGKVIMVRLVSNLEKRDMLLIASIRNYCTSKTVGQAFHHELTFFKRVREMYFASLPHSAWHENNAAAINRYYQQQFQQLGIALLNSRSVLRSLPVLFAFDNKPSAWKELLSLSGASQKAADCFSRVELCKLSFRSARSDEEMVWMLRRVYAMRVVRKESISGEGHYRFVSKVFKELLAASQFLKEPLASLVDDQGNTSQIKELLCNSDPNTSTGTIRSLIQNVFGRGTRIFNSEQNDEEAEVEKRNKTRENIAAREGMTVMSRTESACGSKRRCSSHSLRSNAVRKVRRTSRGKYELLDKDMVEEEDEEADKPFPEFEEVPSKISPQAHDSEFPALCPYPSKIRQAVSKRTVDLIRGEVRKCIPSNSLDEAHQSGYNQASLLHCGYVVLKDVLSNSSLIAEDLKEYLSFLEAMFIGRKEHPLARDFWEHIFNANETKRGVSSTSENSVRGNNRYQTTKTSANRLEETFPGQFQRKLRIDLFLSQLLETMSLLGEQGKHHINYGGSRALTTLSPCAAQKPHVDYRFSRKRHKNPSYFAMVSGRKGFSIYVWRSSHRAGIIRGSDKYIAELQRSWPCEKVEVPPFSVVLVRGGLVHAGAESAHGEEINIRLHFYLPYVDEKVEDLTELCPLFRFSMED